jgi:hypothetical protein
MSSSPAAAPKPKKSVALSGVTAGNTALCTVGRSGNDLQYRGYDILDFAEQAEFEEVAYLLVHEKLPNIDELRKYKQKLAALRSLPAQLRNVLEQVPKTAHPMDVMRTGCSVLGTLEPEDEKHAAEGARNIADRLMASFGSMLPIGITTRMAENESRRRPTTIRRRSLPATCSMARSRGPWVRKPTLAHPVCRARVQRQHLHLSRHRRHRLGHVQRDHRRHRRAAGPQARRRERSVGRDSKTISECR